MKKTADRKIYVMNININYSFMVDDFVLLFDNNNSNKNLCLTYLRHSNINPKSEYRSLDCLFKSFDTILVSSQQIVEKKKQK